MCSKLSFMGQFKIPLFKMENTILKISSQFLTNDQRRQNKGLTDHVFCIKATFSHRIEYFWIRVIYGDIRTRTCNFCIPCAMVCYFFWPPKFPNKHKFSCPRVCDRKRPSSSKRHAYMTAKDPIVQCGERNI